MAESEALVDPAVSRAKFDRELAQYRRLEEAYIRRGWWLVRAEFPEVFVVFGVPQLKPPAVAFGAILDFTNYDMWPPSVRLVDPFTRAAYRFRDLPNQLLQRVPAAAPPPLLAALVGHQGQVQGPPQALMQAVSQEEIPFLCLRGVREYHTHPGHSGDLWLLRRGDGIGTLVDLMEQLHKYGVAPLTEYRRELLIRVVGFEQESVPE